MAKALYIHIPFCDQICSYCDFPKVFSKGQDTDAYLTSLITELARYEKTIGFSRLQTVYIGGGTPTVLTTNQLDKLFVYLHAVINFDQLEEVSIEANPESLNDVAKIACLKGHGVTRVSLGVQTFNENHLQILERSHTRKDVEAVVALLSKENFQINLDMIYGIPTQTLKDWEDDLAIICQLPITHVSAYSLILEEHTKFYLAYMKDKLNLIDNVVEAKMFERVIDQLTAAGFEHYEISNFTRGERSKHNLAYWKNQCYIGVGLGAHGQIGDQPVRYENTRGISKYKQALAAGDLPVSKAHPLTWKEQIEESMFLGLRLMEGVDLNQLNNRYRKSTDKDTSNRGVSNKDVFALYNKLGEGRQQSVCALYNESATEPLDVFSLYNKRIDKLRKQGYVSFEAGVLKLTRKGLMMANDVFEEFLLS